MRGSWASPEVGGRVTPVVAVWAVVSVLAALRRRDQLVHQNVVRVAEAVELALLLRGLRLQLVILSDLASRLRLQPLRLLLAPPRFDLHAFGLANPLVRTCVRLFDLRVALALQRAHALLEHFVLPCELLVALLGCGPGQLLLKGSERLLYQSVAVFLPLALQQLADELNRNLVLQVRCLRPGCLLRRCLARRGRLAHRRRCVAHWVVLKVAALAAPLASGWARLGVGGARAAERAEAGEGLLAVLPTLRIGGKQLALSDPAVRSKAIAQKL